MTRDGACKLAWSYADEASPHLHQPRLVRERVIDAPRAIASEILRCLHDIQSRVAVGGDPSTWPHPFPTAVVARLVDALAARP